MDRLLRTTFGTSSDARVAVDYLRTFCEGRDSLPQTSLGPHCVTAPLELCVRHRSVPLSLPAQPNVDPWMAYVFLPQYDIGRFVLGVAAIPNPPTLAIMALGLRPDEWKQRYIHVRFVYDKMDHWVSFLARFGVERTNGTPARCDGAMHFRFKSNDASGVAIREMTTFRIEDSDDNGVEVCGATMKQACERCRAQRSVCRCIATSKRSRGPSMALQTAKDLSWDCLRRFYKEMPKNENAITSNLVRVTVNAQTGSQVTLGHTDIKASLELTKQGKSTVLDCFPGVLGGSICLNPTTPTDWSAAQARTKWTTTGQAPQQRKEVARRNAPVQNGCAKLGNTCPHCAKFFSRRSNLKRHVDAVHSGRRPFICSFCHFRFQYKQHLKVHVDCQHFHRTFPCALCGSSFVTRSNLKRHTRQIHNQ
eukprot:Plantae.Rhodophyta-Rhodochaete_pulchella.ctg208.p1 GENE.Plantae.Rhodophyta-Rhodochaete_pulchella.ctg208~~Plantae.Rhodophyta-Rhodochaete_pulchella.ctg208.p1  ORF type:complete len:420 (-),score=15.64 Plantae.Rhodophyta-Rhodochaete_pulchella.ctg208:265-1524(-)